MTEVASTVQELQSRVQRGLDSGLADQCLAKWAQAGLTEPPRAVWFPRPVFPHATMAMQVFEIADDGEVDAILFADDRRGAPKHNLRDVMGRLCVPVIDLGGRASAFADVFFDLNRPETWGDAARQILAWRERRRRLAAAYRTTIEPHFRLLAHAFVSGRSVTAQRHPQIKEAVCYPGYWSAGATTLAAERLVRDGYMRKTFFDRMHECRACSSRRLSVREECPSCRSPQLTEVEFIHHYHCATLLPEDKFRKGSALVCPKCTQQLRNYGKDYDKPGRAMWCADCDKTTSEPEVGFVCLDCSAESAGDEARQTDIWSYEITDAGAALVTQPAQPVTSPLEDWKQRIVATTGPIAVAEISYGARQAVAQTHGEAVFERLRRLFVENMSNLLADRGEHRSGPACDYFLLPDYDEDFVGRMDTLMAESSSVLSAALEPRLRVSKRPANAA